MGKKIDIDYAVGSNVKVIEYITKPTHKLLGLENSYLNTNIGINGEDLTILVLSLNRSKLTEKLIHSIRDKIPNFKGELLIVDNNSEEKEIEYLNEVIKNVSFEVRIVRFNKNYGVSGGRNRGIKYASRNWVMFLDNDIYFINNPLNKIVYDISLLGCRFINMPLLDETGEKIFSYGGHIYLDKMDSSLLIGGGSVYGQSTYLSGQEDQPFLSTFLFGGASIVNKRAFLEINGFDEAMFIGFEDLDFSIKLYRKGLKVGNCGTLSLVHAHPKPDSKADRNYEKERFSEEILKKSAKYFEKKHGFSVWNNSVEEWLRIKSEELELKVKNNRKKYKIVLVTDTDDWAFANIAKYIKKYLSEYYDFEIIPMNLIIFQRVLFMTQEYDLVHFFWRTHVSALQNDETKAYFKNIKLDFFKFMENYRSHIKISTCVYDHLFLGEDYDNLNTEIFSFVDAYYVSSKKLYNIYNTSNFSLNLKKIITDGVDLEKFYLKNNNKFDDIEKRKVVIGWSGNSKWSDHLDDPKGLHSILTPTLKKLSEEGYEFQIYYADKAKKHIPYEDMPEYYEKIDIFICVSSMEGTPNPVLEAMACGIPVISTNVGIVPEVFGEKQKEFILEERNVESLEEKLKNLLNNRYKLSELSKENLNSIKVWDWKIKIKKFKEYFDDLLKR